ncbi:MAG: HAD family hydrolase [Promethearchaeota archaeon]
MISEELIIRLQTRKIRVIIFDFDGTLLDINKALRKSIENVFYDYNIKANIDLAMSEIGAVLESIQGYPLPKIILESHQIFGVINTLKHLTYLKKLKIGAKVFSKFLEYSKNAKFFPKVKETIKNLSKFHDLFIVSHNKTREILEHLERQGLKNYFTGIFGSDDLPKLKPHPDAFLPVFKSLPALRSDEVIMIGDMPTDIQAGQEAGFYTIGISSGISKKEFLTQFNPDFICASFKDFSEILEHQVQKSNSKEIIKIKS